MMGLDRIFLLISIVSLGCSGESADTAATERLARSDTAETEQVARVDSTDAEQVPPAELPRIQTRLGVSWEFEADRAEKNEILTVVQQLEQATDQPTPVVYGVVYRFSGAEEARRYLLRARLAGPMDNWGISPWRHL